MTNLPDHQLEAIARAFCTSEGLRFIEYVTSGGFKETYKAKRSNGLYVAVKVFREGMVSQRTQREIEAVRRCSHPQIAELESVKTMNVGGVEHLVISEEFLSGGTLSRHLEQTGRLSVSDTRRLGIGLIDALAHIADLGLVHRDLKPDNIIFRESGGVPVIVDFGLVRDLNADSLTESWWLQGPGTPFFAPAEQLLNDKALIDWRSDQFSLGVVLSIAATGMHPYQEEGEDMRATVDRVVRHMGPTVRFRSAATSLNLVVLERMVAPWPVQRFRTAGQLAAAWTSGGV